MAVSDVYPSRSLWALRRAEEDPLVFLLALAATGLDVVPFQLGRRQAFLLNHPTLVDEVLVRHPEIFVKGRGFDRAKRLLGNGLLTASRPLHAERRRIAEPAFRRQPLASYAPIMIDHAERVRDRWAQETIVNISHEMRELTLAIAGDALFGADLAGMTTEVGRAVAMALPSMDGLVSLVASLRRTRAARRDLDGIVDAIVERRIRSGELRDDLLSLLLAAREGREETSAQQLRDDAVTFLLASHDTMGHALTWTWMLLAQHPEAEAQLHTEIAEVVGARRLSAHDVPRLTYTKGVLAEALRLFPPAWAIVRQASEAYQCGDAQIPPGALVVASPFVTHRDARFFPDPLSFEPRRWLTAPPAPRLAYFPFGAGPRSCIGEGFAWMEGTLVLATLAAKWRLRLESDTVQMSPRITLRPREPVVMVPHAYS